MWNNFGTKMFHECVLLKDIGVYKNGDYFETITLEDDNITLNFYIDDDQLDLGKPVMTKHLGIID